MEAWLALEDGTVFEGESFGATGEKAGEVVFNTSMIGYQEVLTDPSYKGQIVTMTYPLIGNYGVNPGDLESLYPHVEGFVVREYQRNPSNWRSTDTLDRFLADHGVVGISGIDTRALTRRLRVDGVMRGVIHSGKADPDALVSQAKAVPKLVGRDLVREVTTDRPYRWENDRRIYMDPPGGDPENTWNDFDEPGTFRVVVMDYGVKHNILRNLARRDCQGARAAGGLHG